MLASLLFIFSVGAVAGFIAGLFGIGGGVVIVPALIVALNHQGIDPEIVIHLAIGTSLATIAVTGASSAYGHWRQGAVARELLMRMLPGLIAGSVLGGVIASLIRADLLERFFGLFLILLALRLMLSRMPSPREEGAGRFVMASAGTVVGAFSALFGIGGGLLSVPWLVRCGATLQRAIGTSAACGFPIALVGALTFVVTGLGDGRLPPGSTGYLYWPAFAGMIVCSVPLARLGVLVAHRLSALLLRRLFALMILGIGVRLLL
jgi:uncharacterized protein